MAEVTVQQFAGVVGISVDRLVAQLSEAGLPTKGAEDMISDDEKSQLLSYLRKMHGKNEVASEPAKITLQRKTVSELKVPAERGRLRTQALRTHHLQSYTKNKLGKTKPKLQTVPKLELKLVF